MAETDGQSFKNMIICELVYLVWEYFLTCTGQIGYNSVHRYLGNCYDCQPSHEIARRLPGDLPDYSQRLLGQFRGKNISIPNANIPWLNKYIKGIIANIIRISITLWPEPLKHITHS